MKITQLGRGVFFPKRVIISQDKSTPGSSFILGKKLWGVLKSGKNVLGGTYFGEFFFPVTPGFRGSLFCPLDAIEQSKGADADAFTLT